MSEILTDVCSADVPLAIERNGVDCCLAWGEWAGMELGREEHLVWTLTDVPFAFFNNVFNARLPEGGIESAIAEATDRFRRRGVPAFWWTGPASEPDDLGRYLKAAGYQHGFQAAAMAVDLDGVKDTESPAGLLIEEVLDRSALQQWCDVMAPVYEFPDFAREPWLEMLFAVGLGRERPLRHFAARLDGRVVATASLYFGAGVAGISSVATLPDYRRRGIGTAITVALVEESRRAGYRVGTLFASPMGKPMYERIGFRQYSEGNCYVWAE